MPIPYLPGSPVVDDEPCVRIAGRPILRPVATGPSTAGSPPSSASPPARNGLTPGSARSAETLSRMTIRTPDVATSPSTTGALCVPVVCRPAKGMRSSAAVQGEARCKRPACDTDRTACCRREREDRNPFDEPDHLLPADSGYMCKAFSRLRGVDPDQPERAAREPKVRRLPAGAKRIRTLGPTLGIIVSR